MPAAVYQGDRTITVERLPVPDPGPGQVLLEVSHCGVCGSDLHMVMEGWGQVGSTGGHEYSGTIVALGDGVSGWQVGDRVVGGPDHGCGECEPCRTGLTHLCVGKGLAGTGGYQGAFAAYKLLDVDSAYLVPDIVDLRTAALTEPLAVAYRGVRQSRVQPGQRALVTGAGPIGLLTVAVLRATGADD